MDNNHLRPPEETVSPEVYGEEYFLSECQGWEEFVSSGGTTLPKRMEIALQAASLEPGLRVLDIGSGRGEVVLHIARNHAHAWGIDYSEDALRLAQSLWRDQPAEIRARAHLLRADAQSLPFEDCSFDRVLMLDIVEHLYPAQLATTLGEAWRVLRDGGVLVVHTMPNLWYYRYGYPLFRVLQRLRGKRLPRDPRQRWRFVPHVHVNEQDVLSLRSSLLRAGFRPHIWLQLTEDFQREVNPLMRTAMHIAATWYPFKWIFCGEIFAVAKKG